MPAFTSGLGSQCALAAETTYGTIVTPNRFFEYASENMNLSRSFLLSSQLRAGRMYQSSPRRSATTRSAAGTVALEVPTAGFGPWLNLLHGNTVVPAKEAATVMYKQVHNIGTTDPFGKSVTLQIGKPNTAGTVEPYTYPGSIATSLAFSCQTGGFLDVTATLDSQDEQTGTGLAAASYPTGLESFNFTQCVVKVNSVTQTQVRGVTVTINGPRDTSRYYLGAEKKAVPLTNAYNGAAISLTVDYLDQSLYTLFNNASIVPVEVAFVGAAQEAIKKELKFVCAACGLDGDSPNVAGPAVVQQTVPLVVLDNGAAQPVVATYVSADVTL